MDLDPSGLRGQAQGLGDFTIGELVHGPHDQSRSVHFRELMQSTEHATELFSPIRSCVGIGRLIGHVFVQFGSRPLSPDELEIGVARNREEIGLHALRADPRRRGPGSDERLRRPAPRVFVDT